MTLWVEGIPGEIVPSEPTTNIRIRFVKPEVGKHADSLFTFCAAGQKCVSIGVVALYLSRPQVLLWYHSDHKLANIQHKNKDKPKKTMLAVIKTDNEGLRSKDAVHGSSKFMPAELTLVAEANLTDYAPCPCACLKPCLLQAQHERTYVRLYDNRLETNTPIAPCCCFTKDLCIIDRIAVYPFDKVPNAPGMFCCCIPCTCRGRPTIFNKVSKCCGVPLTPYCGEEIRASPGSFFGLRCYICVGQPCYEVCSVPLTPPLQEGGETFVGVYRGALEQFQRKHDRSEAHTARFTRVQDGFCNCDTTEEVPAIVMER